MPPLERRRRDWFGIPSTELIKTNNILRTKLPGLDWWAGDLKVR
jgi:hypothetical protein